MTLDRLLRDTWSRSDALFALVQDEAWLERPIPLRQPFLFYAGHLPAFAWNHLGRGLLRRVSFDPGLDALFARGIDPFEVSQVEAPASWPEREAVLAYRDRVRRELTRALPSADADAQTEDLVTMVVEHEAMHHETLLYMIQELDHGAKRRPAGWPPLPVPGRSAALRRVEVPAGETVIGARPGTLAFGWDNEYPEERVQVPRFSIDDRPVTNERWREFVADGGYRDRRLWRDEDWDWRARTGLLRPHSWRAAAAAETDPDALHVRGLLEDVPFAHAASWPVVVSWSEAAAFARWQGGRLPTEAEWQRTAYGSPSGEPRAWPWGDAPLDPTRANADLSSASPVPAGSCAAGTSAWGVLDLVGNGWEWTSSVFAPLPGFEPMARYPGYSADFFDGCHFVLLGGSWATEERLLRRSFRNWFQPHYPFVFSKLRCVHASGTVSGV